MSEKRKAADDETKVDEHYEDRHKRMHNEAANDLIASGAVGSLEKATTRAKEFETLILPKLKQALGDAVDWLPELKTVALPYDNDHFQPPSPLIHFASLVGRSRIRSKFKSGFYWIERLMCYCPVNNWLVFAASSESEYGYISRPDELEYFKSICKLSSLWERSSLEERENYFKTKEAEKCPETP